MERAKGFEPSTPTLARLYSTTELRPRVIFSGSGNIFIPKHFATTFKALKNNKKSPL
jgi:hypothetical protein